MKLSYKQALWAAYTVLDILFEERSQHKLRFLLSDMCPFTFQDGSCSDPAIKQSWLNCSKQVNDAGFLFDDQVMTTLILFLQANEPLYACFEQDGDYETSDVKNHLTYFVNNGRWDDILNKVSGREKLC